MMVSRNLVRRGDRFDVDPATGFVEFHMTLDQSEDGVIAAEADIAAGLELRSALTQNDVARNDGFAAEFFHAEAFADAVASVFDAALSFFMRHKPELRGDGFDFEPGELTAVTHRAVIALAAFEFESDDLLVLELVNDLGRDGGALEERGSDGNLGAV